jgi:hypothetical protein
VGAEAVVRLMCAPLDKRSWRDTSQIDIFRSLLNLGVRRIDLFGLQFAALFSGLR